MILFLKITVVPPGGGLLAPPQPSDGDGGTCGLDTRPRECDRETPANRSARLVWAVEGMEEKFSLSLLGAIMVFND